MRWLCLAWSHVVLAGVGLLLSVGLLLLLLVHDGIGCIHWLCAEGVEVGGGLAGVGGWWWALLHCHWLRRHLHDIAGGLWIHGNGLDAGGSGRWDWFAPVVGVSSAGRDCALNLLLLLLLSDRGHVVAGRY